MYQANCYKKAGSATVTSDKTAFKTKALLVEMVTV